MSQRRAGVGGVDARVYGFRHGSLISNGKADTYRMNCGFYDGHVEKLATWPPGTPSIGMKEFPG